MSIISLKWDYAFKELLTHEVIRRGFIGDVLEIPAEQIREVRLTNTFLWKTYRMQKQGVLDIEVELDNDTRIDIELQIRFFAEWDKRSLYYLAKMFTADLRRGEDYSRLKRCICINILDFNFREGEEYHTIYRMRDAKGNDFSDLFEIHIIELGKELTGTGLDDWIRLFNAKTEEDLEMIKTDNPGIQAAIREVRRMSLGRKLRAIYEQHLMEERDRRAIDKYMRETAQKEGWEKGQKEGWEKGQKEGWEKGQKEGWEKGHEEGWIAGRTEGRAEGELDGLRFAIMELLKKKGIITSNVQECLEQQGDVEILKQWCVMAAAAKSVKEFENQIVEK